MVVRHSLIDVKPIYWFPSRGSILQKLILGFFRPFLHLATQTLCVRTKHLYMLDICYCALFVLLWGISLYKVLLSIPVHEQY